MIKDVNGINQNNDYNAARPVINTEWSALKMNQTITGTSDMGLLIPVFYRELLPGQNIDINQEIAIQFFPFVSDLFHRISGKIIWGVSPHRLMWDEWEDFITGGQDGLNASVHPVLDLNTLYTGAPSNELLDTVIDKLGWPISDESCASAAAVDAIKPSAFPVRTYNKIWNDIIRDPDISTAEINQDNITLLRDYWDHDYYTRARIYQQRGTIPSVPIADAALQLEHEIEFGSWSGDTWTGGGDDTGQIGIQTDAASSGNGLTHDDFAIGGGISDTIEFTTGTLTGAVKNMRTMPHSLDAMGMNMNDWLIAYGITKYQTNNARMKPRYVDHLRFRFKVLDQDVRLDRAEYLTTNSFNIMTEPVVQTSYGDSGSGETEQGNITGQATGQAVNLRAKYEAKEHCHIMALMVIKPKTVYEGGLDRMLVRQTKEDYGTPEFANLPDVPILESELLYRPQSADNNTEFAWQCIYEEYRTMQNLVTGLFRPTESNALGSFTLARYWTGAGRPVLNTSFRECNPDKARIMQLPDEPTFKYFIGTRVRTSIPLPMQSDPGILGLPR